MDFGTLTELKCVESWLQEYEKSAGAWLLEKHRPLEFPMVDGVRIKHHDFWGDPAVLGMSRGEGRKSTFRVGRNLDRIRVHFHTKGSGSAIELRPA